MAKRRKPKGRKSRAAPAACQEQKPAGEPRAGRPAPGDGSTATPTPSPPTRRIGVGALLVLLIVLAGFTAHGLCLKNPFYLDDQSHILNSARLLSHDWFGKGHRLTPFALWIWLHSTFGFQSAAFHALNLIIHILTAFATWFAAREFSRLEPVRRTLAGTPIERSFPFWTALLFVVHTLCSEVVNYASQTSIELVTLFTVIATGALFRWLTVGRWWWLLSAFLATGLAAISKQPGIWHALVNLVLVAVIFWKSLPVLRRGESVRSLPLIITVLVFGGLCYWFLREWGLIHHVGRIFSDPEMRWHWLTQSRVFWQYAWRMFVPVRLCSDHWIPVTRSADDGVAWIAAAGLGALLVIGLLLFRRQRASCLLLALTIAPLLLRFGFRNQEVFVEYRTYPVMPWFCMLCTFVTGTFLLKRTRPARFAIGAAVIAAGLAGLSARRSVTWNDPRTLITDIQRQYPLHLRSRSHQQHLDFSSGQYQAVIDRQVLVRQLVSDIFKFNHQDGRRTYVVPQVLNSYMFCEQSNAYALVELGRSREALDRLTEVIRFIKTGLGNDRGKAFGVLYRARGNAHASLQQFDQAAADYERALERLPDDLETQRLVDALPPHFRATAIPQARPTPHPAPIPPEPRPK